MVKRATSSSRRLVQRGFPCPVALRCRALVRRATRGLQQVDVAPLLRSMAAPEPQRWHVQLGADNVKVMSRVQLEEAARLSIVQASTLVWTRGMKAWCTYESLGKPPVKADAARAAIALTAKDPREQDRTTQPEVPLSKSTRAQEAEVSMTPSMHYWLARAHEVAAEELARQAAQRQTTKADAATTDRPAVAEFSAPPSDGSPATRKIDSSQWNASEAPATSAEARLAAPPEDPSPSRIADHFEERTRVSQAIPFLEERDPDTGVHNVPNLPTSGDPFDSPRRIWNVQFRDGHVERMGYRELRQAQQSGAISSSTLIWSDGMVDWQPLGHLRPKSTPPPGTLRSPGVAASVPPLPDYQLQDVRPEPLRVPLRASLAMSAAKYGALETPHLAARPIEPRSVSHRSFTLSSSDTDLWGPTGNTGTRSESFAPTSIEVPKLATRERHHHPRTWLYVAASALFVVALYRNGVSDDLASATGASKVQQNRARALSATDQNAPAGTRRFVESVRRRYKLDQLSPTGPVGSNQPKLRPEHAEPRLDIALPAKNAPAGNTPAALENAPAQEHSGQ